MSDAHLDLNWPAYAEEIGWRLATVRRLRGVSQLELAGVTGVSRTQIQNIEQNKTFKKGEAGNTTLRTLFVLAQALGVSPLVFIPDGVPQPDYRTPAGADRDRLAAELADRVTARPLPSSTRRSGRVR